MRSSADDDTRRHDADERRALQRTDGDAAVRDPADDARHQGPDRGHGPGSESRETVTVNYVGALYKGGKVFDASWKRKEPFTFVLGKGPVIAGWDQGVAGMKVGGRRLLIIPAPLGYGAGGSLAATIPPNAALVFVVDLLGT